MRITHKLTPRIGIVLCLGACLSFGSAAQTAESITLAEALTLASKNLETQIAQLQLTSAHADIVAANRAPLPILSTGVSQIDLQNGVGAGSIFGDKRIDKNIGIDWTWERGDKRSLRTKAATEAANAAALDVSESLIQQKLQASSSFFDLWGAQARITQISAIAGSAAQLANAASKRLAAGDLSAQDALRSQIEAQRAQNDAALAEQERARAESALRLVLGSPQKRLAAAHADALQTKLDMAYSPIPALAIEQRADVQASLSRTFAARAQVDAALALQKNDITLGAAYDHFPGTSNRLLTFRMQMPLQLGALGGYSFQGEIAKAQSQLAIAETALERTRQTANNDMQRQYTELLSSQARANSYSKNIAAQSKRVADQAELAYNKGALSLTELLEARRTWRATALEAIAAQTDFERALAAWTIRTESLK